jgi:hypothetical protein
MRRVLSGAILVASLTLSGCAEPPNKEMDQAQGAIDAARAAGAEEYAATEFAAATGTLAQAHEAVAQRDYRLALNHALESREHAQNAAREAADTRARIRGEVERAMAEAEALLAKANATVAAAEGTRVPRRTLREAQQALAAISAEVQKAGSAMKAEDYMGAQPMLDGLKERIEQVIASVATPATRQSAPRRR